MEGEDDLVCVVDVESTDADGDAITYTFAWTVDGAAWGGSTATTYRTGDTIAAADTAMDDVGGCVVVPSDGDLDGTSASASVVVLHGFVGGDISLSAAGAKLIGEDDFDNAGGTVASAGDVNGDGYDDVIVGARYHFSTGATCPGSAYVAFGPVTDEVDLSYAGAELVGVAHSEEAGGSVASAGDVNADGYADLLVGARYRSVGAAYTGTAYLVLGPVVGEISLSLADGTYTGEDAYDIAGRVVAGAGDVDGDGYDDVLVGASADTGGSLSGTTYLIYGPRVGTSSLSTADACLIRGVLEAVVGAGQRQAHPVPRLSRDPAQGQVPLLTVREWAGQVAPEGRDAQGLQLKRRQRGASGAGQGAPRWGPALTLLSELDHREAVDLTPFFVPLDEPHERIDTRR